MPEKRGRKRRARVRPGRGDRPVAPTDTADVPPSAPDQSPGRAIRPAGAPSSDLPKLRVRAAGFVVGLITLFIGILNVAQGVRNSDATYAITGGVMIVLAIFLGALTLVPGRLRAFLVRK